MPRTKITVIGLDRVVQDFQSFSLSGIKAAPDFLNLISDSAISLLKQNTPVDTGDLANSWRVLERDSNSVTIGVSDENDDKLRIILEGTAPHIIEPQTKKGLLTPFGIFRRIKHPGTSPNNFLEAVQFEMNRLVGEKMGDALAQSHRFHQPFANRANLSKIVGLTGTRFSPRRAFGRSTIIRPRTGLLSLRVRIGRRRRTGGSILNKLWLTKVG